MTRSQRIVVSVILRSESGVLLLQRSQPFSEFREHDPDVHFGAGLWELPGGGLDFGETALRAGVRETSEETGILIEQGNLKLVACCAYTLKGSECESHRIHVIYEANLNAAPQIELNEEHVAYKWVRDSATFGELPMVAEIRDVIATSM
jgi:8-oxo-dGTP pyrophosphatase MutT (NUDIX family)